MSGFRVSALLKNFGLVSTCFSAVVAFAILSASACANDELLTREFVNCHVITRILERVLKDPKQQVTMHGLSARFNVYAYALEEKDFVRAEKTKAEHLWRDKMLQVFSGKEDAGRLHTQLTDGLATCLKTLDANKDAIKPKVQELKNRIAKENAR